MYIHHDVSNAFHIFVEELSIIARGGEDYFRYDVRGAGLPNLVVHYEDVSTMVVEAG
ncbi:MAG: hypothetical protein QXO20_04625 [Candidatus Bathyarchaeia archaeon]